MVPRLSPRRTLFLGLLLADFLVLYVVFLSHTTHNTPPAFIANHPYFLYDLDSNEPRSPPDQKCVLPRIHPLDPSVWDHFTSPKNIVCKSRRKDFTYVSKDGVLRFDRSVVEDSGYRVGKSLHCFWRNVRRAGENEEDDDKVEYGTEFPLHEDGTSLPVHVEVVQVRCLNFAGLSVYEMLHFRIRNSTKHDKQNAELKNHVNILIFGLDSMSRLAFIRLLPRTYRYLTEQLNMTVFRGMNKIGDNTYPNLVALLTGREAYGSGLPSHPEGFDDWPLIWKNYSNAGYVTMWAEDFPQFGLFNYLDKGFRHPPTDHYLRPFWLSVEESTLLKFSSHMCYGSEPKHMLQMDYVRKFISTYEEAGKPYFGFSFLAELSHEYLSRVASADEQFEEFFRFLQEGGHLKKTVLIAMSDHGHRFDAIRSTQVGHIEERMPFFAMHIPSTISSTQPEIINTLSTNAGRLVTPYDTYATLVDLLYFITKDQTLGKSSSPLGTLGQSFFKEVSLKRTCKKASIPSHYCTCESESPISASDVRVTSAAEATIRHINNLVKDGGSDIAGRCSVLSLKAIRSAHIVQLEEESDINSKVRVVVEALPSGGIFEATVLVGNKETCVLGDVSRINSYSHQSGCIRHVILRKYCYCLNLLNLKMNVTNVIVS